MQNPRPIRILVVDDSPAFVDAMTALLAREPDLEVVGQAHSGGEAVGLVLSLKPSLVLMDLAMPGLTGLEAARLMKASPQPPKVIIVSFHSNEGLPAEALGAGVDGFVTKADVPERLLPTVRRLFGPGRVPRSARRRRHA